MVFAIKDGNPIGIGEVPRGLKCGCICVECGQSLVAKKGNVKEHHFAHSVSPTEEQLWKCYESYNHWLLKHIFADLDYMILPAWKTEPEFTINLNPQLARVEKTYQGFRADCVVYGHDGLELIIEVINFNVLNEDKKELIKSKGSDCISVNAFGWISTPVQWSQIKAISDQLKNDPNIKTWVYRSGVEEDILKEGGDEDTTEVQEEAQEELIPTTFYPRDGKMNRRKSLEFTVKIENYHLVESWRKDMLQKNSRAGIIRKNDAELGNPIRNDCKSNQCPFSLKSCWNCGYFKGFSEIISEEEFFCGA